MRTTVKFMGIAAIALTLGACGNDKKNDNGEESSEETVTRDEQMMNTVQNDEGTKTIESSSKSSDMRIDKASLSFKDETSKGVWTSYNAVRLALIASDSEKSKQEAANLAMIFGENNMKLKSAAEAIATTEDLEAQRKAFSQFSVAVQSYFKKNIDAGTLYKQHCPMALNGKGADWLSNEATIKNPYYGDKMLNCGTVTATITK
ncbi:DUF3347 domain-containing protein [Leeuwenhoekiella sp. MAR_2009_132]|uniref:DUF3347 domain-containing protein n=1 Tax=Leeuwenhoekiella sp. MAR_2009_132 TaxID=1392489 RepID=UPI00068FA8F9|nr:DUF3347 domain-containing protein [Leeuwenhoekiella sp. MAR_2009_132]